jgi:hypothetical protein
MGTLANREITMKSRNRWMTLLTAGLLGTATLMMVAALIIAASRP